MQKVKLWAWSRMLFVLTFVLLSMGALGQNVKILHNFNKAKGGDGPSAGLISDAMGNLYGTTPTCTLACLEVHGCAPPQCGTVFELTPPTAGGGWPEKTLHVFGENGKDGWSPSGPVIFDGEGNLYGMTYFGGIYGGGTVFKLIPMASGKWAEKILHNFGNGVDGTHPNGGLILDANGDLFGTTLEGGRHAAGTVFELVPSSSGKFTEKLLHSFGSGADGAAPWAGVTLDQAGNLFGTTVGGGANGFAGTVFELTPASGGAWVEKVLWSFFEGPNGFYPMSRLVLDSAGNLYGTTSFAGQQVEGWDGGTVFELTPETGGSWNMKVLYQFGVDFNLGSGYELYSGVVFDSVGNLYGTTFVGGCCGGGVVYQLSPKNGKWNETILYSQGNPVAPVMVNGSGNLYGATTGGGTNNSGTVFEITP